MNPNDVLDQPIADPTDADVASNGLDGNTIEGQEMQALSEILAGADNSDNSDTDDGGDDAGVFSDGMDGDELGAEEDPDDLP